MAMIMTVAIVFPLPALLTMKEISSHRLLTMNRRLSYGKDMASKITFHQMLPTIKAGLRWLEPLVTELQLQMPNQLPTKSVLHRCTAALNRCRAPKGSGPVEVRSQQIGITLQTF